MFHTTLRQGAVTAVIAATMALAGAAAKAETRLTLKFGVVDQFLLCDDGPAWARCCSRSRTA